MIEHDFRSHRSWETRARYLVAPGLALLLLFAATSCNKSNSLEGKYFNPNLSPFAGGYLEFYGTVDKSLNSSCGTAAVKTSGSTTTTGGTTPTTGGTTSSSSTYTITTYLLFDLGKSPFTLNYPTNRVTLNMKYTYTTGTITSFTMSPITTTNTTCNTQDGIKCLAGGGLVCLTVDNINCGGDSAFSFISQNPAMSFFAYSGTIDWSKGFSLNTAKTAVSMANIKFSMTALDGTLFKGEVDCYIPQ